MTMTPLSDSIVGNHDQAFALSLIFIENSSHFIVFILSFVISICQQK